MKDSRIIFERLIQDHNALFLPARMVKWTVRGHLSHPNGENLLLLTKKHLFQTSVANIRRNFYIIAQENDGHPFKVQCLTQEIEYGILVVMNGIGADIPGVQDVRLVLRAQHVLERYGVCDDGYTHAACAVRRKRIQAVGVRQYIYDILGDSANRPVGRFRLWYFDEPVVLQPELHDERLVDVLVDCELIDVDLSFQLKIEVDDNGKPHTFFI